MLPGYGRWERLWQFWLLHEGMLSAAGSTRRGTRQTEAVSAANDAVRSMLIDVLRAQVADDELFEKMVPHFPPFAKRALRDDGRWAATLARPDVDLVTDPIERITPGGVRTADGVEHPADVLIYGTGFRASDFVAPMRVLGSGGVELNEEWGGDARAYLGITVPGFPNFFMLYGPNTNLVINGSILVMVECQVRYAVEAIGQLLRGGHRTMACRPRRPRALRARDGRGQRRHGVGRGRRALVVPQRPRHGHPELALRPALSTGSAPGSRTCPTSSWPDPTVGTDVSEPAPEPPPEPGPVPAATRRRVRSGSPFEPAIGFSRALRVGDRVVVSGTGPVLAGGGCPEGAAAQARRCLEIVAGALAQAGATLDDVVRTRMYLVSAADAEEVGAVHRGLLGHVAPAATMVVVAGLLDPAWRVEIEAEAVLSGPGR